MPKINKIKKDYQWGTLSKKVSVDSKDQSLINKDYVSNQTDYHYTVHFSASTG